MEKIKLAYVVGGLTTGGVESVIYNYLSHMNREQYELVYISYDTPDKKVKTRFEDLGFTVYEVEKKKEHPIKSCIHVYRILKKHQIEIIHSHMTLICFVTNFIGIAAGCKTRIAHSHLVIQERGIKRVFDALCKKLTLWSSTDLFACSQEAGIYLFGKRTYKNRNVIIMKNAMELRKFCRNEKMRRAMREQYSVSDNEIVIGNVGRFAEQKNHIFLLKVFKEFQRRQNKKCWLLLVGNGPLENKIKNKAKELGIYENIIFAGAVTEPANYYMAMDVFVFPSNYEGLGIVVIEAQLAEIPVVTSDVIPEEVNISGNMMVLSVKDSIDEWVVAIERSINKPACRNAMKEANTRHYEIQQEAACLDEFYKNCRRRRER